jgi:hypothetical protein
VAIYRAAWMSVTFMVGWLGVAVALLSDHAKVNAGVAAVVGMATEVLPHPGGRCMTGCRRQALPPLRLRQHAAARSPARHARR